MTLVTVMMGMKGDDEVIWGGRSDKGDGGDGDDRDCLRSQLTELIPPKSVIPSPASKKRSRYWNSCISGRFSS